MMIIQNVSLDLCVEKPLKILHLSDAHICDADPDDSPDIQRKAMERKIHFEQDNKDAEEWPCDLVERFTEAMEFGKNFDMVVLNGDIIDMLAYGSLRTVRKILDSSGCQWMYGIGNHETCYGPCFDPETIEDKAYRVSCVQPYFSNSLLFSSKIINGVNIVVMDNSNHYFTKQQYEALQLEIEKGYPILLFLHIPLYAESLVEHLIAKKSSLSIVGCPTDVLIKAGGDNIRFAPDNVTLMTVNLIENTKLIKAVFAAHLHFPHADVLPGGTMQYINGVAFGRRCTVIEIK